MDIEQQILEHKINIESGNLTSMKSHGKVASKLSLNVIDRELSKNEYILGPGDALALNIVSIESRTFNLIVTPTGDLLIPSMGVISVSKMTIADAELKVKEFIKNNFYPLATIDLVLINLRKFKVKVQGAVSSPGYVSITSNQRLYDVIQSVGGFHRDADESNIIIIDSDGFSRTYSLKYYNQIHDDKNNPLIHYENIITVPFMNINDKIISNIITAKKNPINITGYTRRPGEYPYHMGYTVIDYINMAGGVLDNGSINRVRLYREGGDMIPKLTEYVMPGDQLYIPPNFRYQVFGESSLITTTTAVLSLYLTFLAIQN